MSAQSQFNDFQEVFSHILGRSGVGMELLADGETGIKSYEDLYKVLEVTELVEELKGLAQGTAIEASKWVPLTARIDYMTAAARDMRMRTRNCVQAMRLRNDNGASKSTDRVPSIGFAGDALNQFAQAMTKIESGI